MSIRNACGLHIRLRNTQNVASLKLTAYLVVRGTERRRLTLQIRCETRIIIKYPKLQRIGQDAAKLSLWGDLSQRA